MEQTKVFFRADGHAQMGLGHVIRSLALAEMLKDDFECYFLIRSPLMSIKEQILEMGIQLVELPDTEDDLAEAGFIVGQYLSGSEIVVLDGYHFVTAYQQIIKDAGCRLLCIDDIHAYHFVADVVINHAGGIRTSNYSAAPYTQFCLGLKYALLRKPFREAARNRHYPNRRNDQVFICLGGADPHNDTLSVLQRCAAIQAIRKIFLVIGSAYLHKTALLDFLEQSEQDVELLENLSAEEIIHYMKRCGVAITPPSTVSYEYLSVGGLLFLKKIANNQLAIHNYFIQQRLAFDITQLSDEWLSQQTNSEQGTDILNSEQAKTYTRLFHSLTLTAKAAGPEEMGLLFDWVNEANTRQQSFHAEPIPFEQHQKWFKAKLADPNCHLYIIYLGEAPIAQVRFDTKDQSAVLSYSLDQAYRGRGLGISVLRKAMATLYEDQQQRLKIVGYVKQSNAASAKVFRALEFKEEETELYENTYKYTLSW